MAGFFTADDWKVGDEISFYKQEFTGDKTKPKGEIYFAETFGVDALEAQVAALTAEKDALEDSKVLAIVLAVVATLVAEGILAAIAYYGLGIG